MRWDLKDLFLNYQAYQDEMERLISDINSCSMKLNKVSDIFPKYIEKIWEWKSNLGKMEIYANLTYYLDIHNPLCIERKKEMELHYSELMSKIQDYEKKIMQYELEEVLDFLNQHPNYSMYIRYVKQLYSHQTYQEVLKENQDTLNSYILAYNSLRNQMNFGTILVDGEENVLTFQNLRSYQVHENRSLRKSVFEQIISTFHEKHDTLFSYLQHIFEERVLIAKEKGYPTIRSSKLAELELSESFYFQLLDSCHRHLYLFQKYFTLKLASIQNPCSYDCAMPMVSSISSSFSFSEVVSMMDEIFLLFGTDYLSHFHSCLSNGHLDTNVDLKKHPTIVFTWYGYSFLQYRDTFLDAKNLVHEIGHMMNDVLSISHNPFIYSISSDFIGEIVALVHETLFLRYLMEHAKTKEEKIYYLSKEIENYVSSVFRPMMFQEFEDYLAESLSCSTYEDCCSYYENLLNKYYGNCISNLSSLSEEWIQYDKYYRVSYYSFSYASGKLIANFISHSLLNGNLSGTDFMEFLKSGSSKSAEELLQMIHISLNDPSIFDQGFEFFKQDLTLLEELLHT